jgi:antitoxin ParD1/3/4
MTKSTSFTLGDHFNGFIARQIEQGRYANASEVLRAALRILEEDEAQLAALRAALIEGENSGPAEPFEVESFLSGLRSELQVAG